MQGSKVLIAYDILNSTSKDLFTIGIEITDSKNEVLPSRSLSGDIGKGVSGGSQRKILWDIEADKVFLDEDISVQISAIWENPPLPEKEPEVIEKEAEALISEDDATKKQEISPPGNVKQFNRTAIIAQSLVLPGLGLSRVKGKPHWIKGLVAYGCLGGSIYMNRQAYNNYNAYLESETAADAESLFDSAVKQDKLSRGLAYAAIGVWVTDLVWTIAGTSDLNQSQTSDTQKGFSIDTGVEPLSAAPLLTLRYTF